jgi:hypothetical protein
LGDRFRTSNVDPSSFVFETFGDDYLGSGRRRDVDSGVVGIVLAEVFVSASILLVDIRMFGEPPVNVVVFDVGESADQFPSGSRRC